MLKLQNKSKKVYPINPIFHEGQIQDEQSTENKVIDVQNDSNDIDLFLQTKDETFTIKHEIRIIQMVSIVNILCSLSLTAVGADILYKGGTEWNGHLPRFIETKYIVDIVLSNILLLFSILQIKSLDKMPLSLIQIITLFIFSSFIISSTLSAALFRDSTSSFSQMQQPQSFSQCQKNYDKFWHKNLLTDYEYALSRLCSSDCPCKIEQQNLTKFKQDNPLAIISSEGHKSLLSCSSTLNQIDLQSIKVIKYLEEHWNCSNICNPSHYFLFRQVDYGYPLNQMSCFQLLDEKTSYLVRQIFFPGLIIGILLLFGWIFQLYCIIEIKKYKNYKTLLQEALKTQDTSLSSEDGRFQQNNKQQIQQENLEIKSVNGFLNSKSSVLFQLNKINSPQQDLITFDKQYSILNEEKPNMQFTRLVSPKNNKNINILNHYKQQNVQDYQKKRCEIQLGVDHNH